MSGSISFEVRRRVRLVAVLGASMASIGYAACGACSPSGPTGPAASYTGSVMAAGVAFHDFAPPPGTTQMDVEVQWTPAQVAVRFIHGDPNCDPVQTSGCRAFTDPIGPFPNANGEIRSIITNQGEMAGPRMRLVLRNLDIEQTANYTLTIRPVRAGCT
jgi:hypothetical protein